MKNLHGSYADPGLASICHLIARWWGEALEGRGEPSLYVSRRVAEHYAQRREMEGEVIKSTGEVVLKESV